MLPFFTIGHSSLCCYCGGPATQQDHVIPVSRQTANPNPSCRHSQYGPLAWVCGRCNNFLKNKWFDTFDARCEQIHDWIEAYTLPIEWRIGDYGGLDHSLRTFIVAEQRKRRWMRYRADWFDSRDYLLNLEPLLWEPYFNARNDKFNDPLFNFFRVTLENRTPLTPSRRGSRSGAPWPLA